jgi:WD40 repeat protein
VSTRRWVATVSRDQTVKVWDTASGHEVLTFKGHADNRMLHMSVAFFPDGKRIVSGGDGYQIAAKLWDATTGD